MATQSLYRRYRPRRFDGGGQEHIVRAQRGGQAEGKVRRILGAAGTGKTARILAKVLNCTNPSDGEPCCM